MSSSTKEQESAVKEPSKVELFEETLRELKKNVDHSTAAFAKIETVASELKQIEAAVSELKHIEAAVSEFKQMQEGNNQKWDKLKQLSEEIKAEGDASAKEMLKLVIKQETMGDERTPDGKFKLFLRAFDFKDSNHHEIISNSVLMKDAWWHMVVSNIKGKELILYCDRFVERKGLNNIPYDVSFEVKGKDKPWRIASIKETLKTIYIPSLQFSDQWIQNFIKKFVIDGVAEINVFFDEIKEPAINQPNTKSFQFQLSHLTSILKDSDDEVFSSSFMNSLIPYVAIPRIYITKKLDDGSFCIRVLWQGHAPTWQMLLSTTERISELKVGRKFQTLQDDDKDKSITIPAELILSGELESFVVEIK